MTHIEAGKIIRYGFDWTHMLVDLWVHYVFRLFVWERKVWTYIKANYELRDYKRAAVTKIAFLPLPKLQILRSTFTSYSYMCTCILNLDTRPVPRTCSRQPTNRKARRGRSSCRIWQSTYQAWHDISHFSPHTHSRVVKSYLFPSFLVLFQNREKGKECIGLIVVLSIPNNSARVQQMYITSKATQSEPISLSLSLLHEIKSLCNAKRYANHRNIQQYNIYTQWESIIIDLSGATHGHVHVPTMGDS